MVHPETAAWLMRLVCEIGTYKVTRNHEGRPVAVVRPPPSSRPRYRDVTSYARLEPDGESVVITGPHSEECHLLLHLSQGQWEADQERAECPDADGVDW